MHREQSENVLRTIYKCSAFCSVWKMVATLAAMRSLDRLLAAHEKLLNILIFSKNVQECHDEFVRQWKYGKIVVAGMGELLKVSMFGKKRMMFLLSTEITGCSNVLYAKLIICWVSFSLQRYVMRNLYLTFAQIKTVIVSLIEYWGNKMGVAKDMLTKLSFLWK